jgi:hypothetical protein
MMNTSLVLAQVLPRFLLPKLSWQAGAGRQQHFRALSILAISQAQIRSSSESQRQHGLRERSNRRCHEVRPSILQNIPSVRSLHATAKQCRDHHFDTLKFVQRLKEEGFTEAQSVAMMKVLSDVIEERCYTECVAIMMYH